VVNSVGSKWGGGGSGCTNNATYSKLTLTNPSRYLRVNIFKIEKILLFAGSAISF
jgi:hypothetical protein